MTIEGNSIFRLLPGVDKVIMEKPLQQMMEKYPHYLIVQVVQDVIAEKREALKHVESEDEALSLRLSPYQVAETVNKKLEVIFNDSLQPLINATGVVLHTNLGRAPLAEKAVLALQNVSSTYSNLEFSLEEGVRDSRYSHLEDLLCFLTGAEAALVVNNNAAAVLLALNTLAAGKDGVVSRGQLVEIGGSFRVPEVMKLSGVNLVEVGTTNKTYVSDYRQAITSETAVLLKVHTSNYRVIGFTSSVSVKELAALGKETKVPVMEDLGSGVLVDLAPYGLPFEPTVQDSIKAGADVVTISGDKLLGGPQAGIILGKSKYIEAMKKNQLTRALRVDKLAIASLEATLKLYLDAEKILHNVPVLKLLTCPTDELLKRAEDVADKLKEKIGHLAFIKIGREDAKVGGGSMPEVTLPSCQVILAPHQISITRLAYLLRTRKPPVVARVKQGELYLDLRSVRQSEEEQMIKAVEQVFIDNEVSS